jgi:hypothetical protein
LAARLVSQGPANAAPVLKTKMEQPAIMSCFIFICLSPVLVKHAQRDERQPTRCLQVPGGYANLGMFNLTPRAFCEDSRWNRFTEG